jgi:hypothetical protein
MHRRDWIYKTGNLMRMPHEIRIDAPPVEMTEFEDTITLKEEIEKWQRDNG